MKTIFIEKLEQLRHEFPEYYIETWGPEDFKEFNYDITHEECQKVAEKLLHDFDPYNGTTLDFVKETVDMVTGNGEYEEDEEDYEYEIGGSE